MRRISLGERLVSGLEGGLGLGLGLGLGMTLMALLCMLVGGLLLQRAPCPRRDSVSFHRP